jgi:tRNA-dihydrouridine synthase A
VHARKAWLQGLSPKENRDIPPLDHDRVYRLKQSRPDLTIVINGGIEDLDQCDQHLRHVDGVMLGRAAYQRPWLLADVDRRIFGEPATRFQAGQKRSKRCCLTWNSASHKATT